MERPRIIMGLDLASRHTGIVIVDNIYYYEYVVLFQGTIDFGGKHNYQRIVSFREQFDKILIDYKPKLVIIEGLAYNSRHKSLIQLVEMSFVVREMLINKDIKFAHVAPKSLKLFVTEKGKASKKFMQEFAEVRWGFKHKNHNIVDAFCLAMAGIYAINFGHKKGLKSLKRILAEFHYE